MVADGDGRDGVTCRFDDACALVAGHERQRRPEGSLNRLAIGRQRPQARSRTSTSPGPTGRAGRPRSAARSRCSSGRRRAPGRHHAQTGESGSQRLNFGSRPPRDVRARRTTARPGVRVGENALGVRGAPGEEAREHRPTAVHAFAVVTEVEADADLALGRVFERPVDQLLREEQRTSLLHRDRPPELRRHELVRMPSCGSPGQWSSRSPR